MLLIATPTRRQQALALLFACFLMSPLAQAKTPEWDAATATFIQPTPKVPQLFALDEALLSNEAEESEAAFEARVQKHLVPRAFMRQQDILGRYKRYRSKIQPLLDKMAATSAYLKTLDPDQAPDVQMLSAKATALKLDWEIIARDIQPYETEYQSWQLLSESVTSLTNISDYWVQANQSRTSLRPTTTAMADDLQYWVEIRHAVLTRSDALAMWQDEEQKISHRPNSF